MKFESFFSALSQFVEYPCANGNFLESTCYWNLYEKYPHLIIYFGGGVAPNIQFVSCSA